MCSRFLKLLLTAGGSAYLAIALRRIPLEGHNNASTSQSGIFYRHQRQRRGAANPARQLAHVGVDTGQTPTAGGERFTMKRTRTYKGYRLNSRQFDSVFASPPDSEMCLRWAVLTSILEPTETVRQLASAEGWCVVVVGDKDGAAEYDVDGVIYLTPADQELLPYRIVPLLPWNHFGRKNVGYLYALHHGAKVIYDVEDNNALTSPEAGVPLALSPFAPASTTTTFALGPDTLVHHPYGCFGGPGNVWPRGFPLDLVNDSNSTRCEAMSVESLTEAVPTGGLALGVVQTLANHHPDVDAVYGLSHSPGDFPFDFEDGGPAPEGLSPLKVVHPSTFTPYNSQATLHFPPAFWGMLLPVTVHRRVSDIWRSYFTQTLLPSTGAAIAFAPAWVEQVRNPHSFVADLQAEQPLYERSGELIAFLATGRRVLAKASKEGLTMHALMEELMVTMYEYGIIEILDVELSQAWLQDLYSVGYNSSTYMLKS